MANSLPFNAVAVDGEYDRVYKAEDWAWYFATFIANGIFPKPSDGLQVVAYNGMEIRVNAGYAFINGYAFRNPATLSVTLDTAEGALNRVDRVEAYIRYMDDFVILSPDKEQLRSWLARIEQFLREELRLEFNPKTTILAAKNGIDFVGYKHRATHRKVRKDSIKRIKRTIKKCESGKITKEQLQKNCRDTQQ